jgi:hypothetical protein
MSKKFCGVASAGDQTVIVPISSPELGGSYGHELKNLVFGPDKNLMLILRLRRMKTQGDNEDSQGDRSEVAGISRLRDTPSAHLRQLGLVQRAPPEDDRKCLEPLLSFRKLHDVQGTAAQGNIAGGPTLAVRQGTGQMIKNKMISAVSFRNIRPFPCCLP